MEFLTAKQAGEWEEICGIAQASQKSLRNEKYFPSAVAEKISTTAFDTLNESISVGKRVNSRYTTHLRIWAN